MTGGPGGNQILSLGVGCELGGIAVHELMHALGVYHTQQRPDRDTYVTVYENNIKPQYVDQYQKASSANSVIYVPYEYGSVMHYAADGAAIPPQITMLANDTFYQMTMGSHQVSTYDLEVINKHYGCRAKCPVSGATSAKCKNGGLPNPRNCTYTCNCPSGYGGNLCNERPSGPGGILNATSEYQLIEYTVGNANSTDVRIKYTYAHHWIKAPTGKKVEVVLYQLPPPDCKRGCPYAGIEIKTDTPVKTGYRFCCVDTTFTHLISQLNPTPVISYNNRHISSFGFMYRFI